MVSLYQVLYLSFIIILIDIRVLRYNENIPWVSLDKNIDSLKHLKMYLKKEAFLLLIYFIDHISSNLAGRIKKLNELHMASKP